MTQELLTQPLSEEAQALMERRDFLIEKGQRAILRETNSLLACALGEHGYQHRLQEARTSVAGGAGRSLTPELYAREAGWGADLSFMSRADPADRHRGANAPVFTSDDDLRGIRAIGRFYTEFDEVGLSLRENIVNYNTGEAINYVCEPLKKGQGEDVAKNLQEWVDGLLRQNRWPGLREKRPMRDAFSDGECLLILSIDEALEFPDIQLADAGHLIDPANLSGAQTQRLGMEYLDWSFGIGTPVGRQDRPKGYFLDWYGQGDYQLLPESRVVHPRLNVPEDVKRGVNDIFIAHISLKRASKGLGAAAQQAAAQAAIAYIEKMAVGTPAQRVQETLNTPGTMAAAVVDALGSRTVTRQSFMGGEIITTADKDFAYGPMGTPAGAKLVEVFNSVLRRVAVRWQFPDFMVTGDPSNNNMASSVVAETPFHRSTRTRQGEWADYYEQLIRKAVELAIAVGRGPKGVPSDPAQIWKLIRVRAKMPDPKERDQLEETSICEIEHNAGVLSVKTWREMKGYDHETEEANLADEQAAALEKMDAEAGIMAKHEIAAAGPGGAAGGKPKGDPNKTRQAVIQKRAAVKAKAKESLADPAGFLEAAKSADWDDSTRRDVAAAVLFDRSDDN